MSAIGHGAQGSTLALFSEAAERMGYAPEVLFRGLPVSTRAPGERVDWSTCRELELRLAALCPAGADPWADLGVRTAERALPRWLRGVAFSLLAPATIFRLVRRVFDPFGYSFLTVEVARSPIGMVARCAFDGIAASDAWRGTVRAAVADLVPGVAVPFLEREGVVTAILPDDGWQTLPGRIAEAARRLRPRSSDELQAEIHALRGQVSALRVEGRASCEAARVARALTALAGGLVASEGAGVEAMAEALDAGVALLAFQDGALRVRHSAGLRPLDRRRLDTLLDPAAPEVRALAERRSIVTLCTADWLAVPVVRDGRAEGVLAVGRALPEAALREAAALVAARPAAPEGERADVVAALAEAEARAEALADALRARDHRDRALATVLTQEMAEALSLVQLPLYAAEDGDPAALADVRSGAERLGAAVRALLDLACAEGTAPAAPASTFDLGELAEDVVTTLRALASGRRVTLSCQREPARLMVNAHLPAVRRAVVHLVASALRATGAGDHVGVRVAAQAGQVALEIEGDAAIGGGEGLLRHVFRGVLRANGGSIEDSAARRGRVRLALPRHAGTEIPAPMVGVDDWIDLASSRPDTIATRDASVLLVSSRPAWLQAVAGLISRRCPVQVDDGGRAGELLASGRYRVLVLADGAGGAAGELAAAAHALTASVVVLSAAPEVERARARLELGADDVIGQPCAPEALLVRLEAAVRRATRATPGTGERAACG
jgi:signal transduction histidine kinase/CheY-like chemotaxis protein